MRKKDELADPNSCLNRAGENEMIFVLLERDVASATAIRAWAIERVRLRKNGPADAQILEAIGCAAKMLMGAEMRCGGKGAFLLEKTGLSLAEEIDCELAASERHGVKFASLHEAWAVISEELDELWEIVRLKRRDRESEQLREELVQIAAMAIKAVKSMDNFVGGTV
jgi:hypothetical protein